MNLLSVLLTSMLSSTAVDALSGKTGLSKSVVKKLVALAIPILLKSMTSNASSASGASSLLGALMQHTNKNSFADQIQEADTDDGGKIIGHILGSDQDKVVKDLAGQSGVGADQVAALLSAMAPALMSGVSQANQSQASAGSQGADLSSMLSLFGGMGQQAQPEAKPA
ncbi:MAG: DUF937 domain-containing protein, partial [Lachnospiraceae bacterium]|nr:DUF937 domain-containing protein [Lachnospiraceae bacterium]